LYLLQYSPNFIFFYKNYSALKKLAYLLLAGLFSLALLNSNAQKKLLNPTLQNPSPVTQSPQRSCPTFELMDQVFQTDPSAKARYARTQQQLNQQLRQNRIDPQFRIQAIIDVPVVVHVLLPAAQQALVTDAIVQSQIDTLNFYYGGSPFNQDSLRVYAPFRTTYGRSVIRFCLAQRTPAGLPTNGITRTVTNTIYDGTNTPGNAIVWNPVKYLNIWVINAGNTSGLLGYSYLPGTWPASDPHQGYVNDYRAFGAGPGTSSGGYHYNDYNQGKTAVHEIGHYFNLYHPWGPNNTDNPSCTLSDECDDTPPSAEPFFGCPSTIPVTNDCSPVAPGIMWQNNMDYADDRCMILFTNDQCARMMTAVTTSSDRVGLLTSDGCVPPPPAAGNDASISAIITPLDGSTLACSSIAPVVTIKNIGSNTLTSTTINVRLDGGLVGTQNWTGSLAEGESLNITLASLAIPANGSHTLKVHTSLPNGLVDVDAANDTATSEFTKIESATLPVSHGFEAEFLPEGWSVSNPDADNTWFWDTPGAGGAGTRAAAIDNFSGNGSNIGHADDLNVISINTSDLLANDSVLVTFDLAYKNIPGKNDVLQVLASNDCGGTHTIIWEKSGAALATAGSSTISYTTPVAADWIKQRTAIGQNLFGGGEVQFAFRNISDKGNIVWIDNINVDMKPRKDLVAEAIVRPNVTECAPPFAPSLTVKNAGDETVTAFKTGYILNGGAPVIQSHNISLAHGASATVTFPDINPPSGNNTIKLFVADPVTVSPGPDGTPANDTLTREFIVPVIVTRVAEGFEGTAFPPNNWFRINSDNAITWQRTASGKASNFSAFVDNYNYATDVYLFDYLQAPPVNTAGADSLIITFDVAHKLYEDDFGTSVDNLSVLIARNCATTFSTVYSKTGEVLATAGSAGTEAYDNPAQSDWRNERVVVNLVTTPANNVIAQFRNADAYGNNIYIDNINISPIFKRDIGVLSVSPDVACSPDFTPTATIHNRGTETVTAFNVSYTIGAGAPVTTNVTGVNLAPGATTNVTLTPGTLASGANDIKVYTSSPVTASGTGDQYLINDTIRRTTYVASSVQAPLVETFEGSFLPAGWAISNPDNDLTWQKAGIGKSSTGSAYLRNFTYFPNGQKDELYTPVIDFTGVDSVKFTFDLAAATRNEPDGIIPMDTLEVLVTRDCGNTFTSVYKKWGSQLQTVDVGSNFAQSTEFIPPGAYLWRTETIDLTSYAPDGPLQLVFRNTTNNQNKVYVDNVNLTTRVLPARLKAEGFIVLPNPFGEQFNLWFVQAPSDLRYITVFNTAGQLIWKKEFDGSTSNVINIDLTGQSAGVYILNLGYSDKSKDTQVRVLKSN
jgi:hypothetical protein